MKKWLIGILLLFAAFIACVFIFIPGQLTISQVTPVKCSPGGAYRALINKWQPGAENGFRFVPGQQLPQGLDVTISADKNIPSRIVIMPLERDSVDLVWTCTYPASNNPFKRIGSYNEAVSIKQSMASALSKFKQYAEQQVNIYGYNIIQTSTTDTMLVAIKSTSTGKPTMQQVYNLVNQLKAYAKNNGAEQTGYPMLNITPLSSEQFQFQVAIPVNKELPAKADFFPRRMVPGHFMMTEVKGGLFTVTDGIQQLQQYAADHQRTSMAIPFQVLVTNRQQEQDTTKWITRIYYPVM